MATIKYSSIELTPRPTNARVSIASDASAAVSGKLDDTKVEAGFMLTSKSSPRVFFVTPSGVWECSRDGKETPVALIDCNPKIHAACAKLLGAAG